MLNPLTHFSSFQVRIPPFRFYSTEHGGRRILLHSLAVSKPSLGKRLERLANHPNANTMFQTDHVQFSQGSSWFPCCLAGLFFFVCYRNAV